MFAVIFEVSPTEQGMDAYLKLAAHLKTMLENQEGCLSIERFESLIEKGKLLSLSFWKDEASIENWRNIMAHRSAQKNGKDNLFLSYRIRVAQVIRDYTDSNRNSAPLDSNQALL